MFVLFIRFSKFYDLDDQLELLYKIRTPKLREWGKNCLDQISYLLFYPSSGTTGIVPRHFTIGFTVAAHHVGST